MLSPNEKRARAAKFAADWKEAGYERGETQSFYNEFFNIFGKSRRSVASYEEPVKKLGNKQGFIDLFWKGMLLVEQKSAGRSLAAAKDQAFAYFPGLKEIDLPRYILACDFQTFELHDLDKDQSHAFGLQELPEKLKLFAFMDGGEVVALKDEDPVNIEASELMGQLHDALKASGFTGHDLERFLVRLVFCLFADDTGIWERNILTQYIERRTAEDGSDLGPKLAQLFEVLNTNKSKRHTSLDEDLQEFEYINGELFAERLGMPSFNSAMRAKLLEACKFNWSKVSPAIFGSLFQSVMDAEKRRAIGAHYTNEQNILKVIGPLFLDSLKDELKRLKARKDTGRTKALRDYQSKLSKLTFFDPACGCGNFLVITYREIRALETEVILEANKSLDLFERESKVDVDQFFGIELEEFPSLIAEIAMWMMDHMMNVRLLDALGVEPPPRIPLKKSPHIVHADALETDWGTVLSPDNCSYVFGNPPFSGAKQQSDAQRAQVHRIANLGKKKGTLDFVCCWFLKAGAYVNATRKSPGIAFVATNSISQGEQVAELWPLLFSRYNLEIAFAHRTFAWGSEARGKANVHVMIVGLTKAAVQPQEKRLFDYPDIKGDPVENNVKAISPYLFDASSLNNPHIVVAEVNQPLCGQPKVIIGSKPIDGGYLIFKENEANAFRAREPNVEPFLRPYIGGVEYLNGRRRWILALQNASPDQIRRMPEVMQCIENVRKYRLGEIGPKNSKNDEFDPPGISSRSLAKTPTAFHVTVLPTSPFLAIPENSSEAREYLPIGWLEPPIIPSNKLRFASNAELSHFAILTSRLHVAWLRAVGGKIKSDFQYSIGIVYNPFPWPDLDDAKKEKLNKLGQAILDARTAHPQSTLADLYDPDTMPADLRKAHEANDKAVDYLYRTAAFASDRERVEFLLARYEQITAPAFAYAANKPTKRGLR